jgi:hypothetical protein
MDGEEFRDNEELTEPNMEELEAEDDDELEEGVEVELDANGKPKIKKDLIDGETVSLEDEIEDEEDEDEEDYFNEYSDGDSE